MAIIVNEKRIETDNEGFLLDPSDWNEDVANSVANIENISLSDDHWMVVRYVRQYYEENQSVPEARKLLKAINKELSEEKATRKYLYKLFPYGYGQQACKIAGMRKPLKLMLDL